MIVRAVFRGGVTRAFWTLDADQIDELFPAMDDDNIQSIIESREFDLTPEDEIIILRNAQWEVLAWVNSDKPYSLTLNTYP